MSAALSPVAQRMFDAGFAPCTQEDTFRLYPELSVDDFNHWRGCGEFGKLSNWKCVGYHRGQDSCTAYVPKRIKKDDVPAYISEKLGITVTADFVDTPHPSLESSNGRDRGIPQGDSIPLKDIRTPEGRRPIDAERVTDLAKSIALVGLLQLPVVRLVQETYTAKDDDGNSTMLTPEYYEVVAGAHRIAAVKQLGWTHVPVLKAAHDTTPAQCSLIEMDENLCRKELSQAELKLIILQRPKLVAAVEAGKVSGINSANAEKMPEPKRSHAKTGKPKGRPVASTDATSDTQIGKLVNLSADTVKRKRLEAEQLGEETLAKVVGTSLDKPRELKALAAMPVPERVALAERAKAGEQVLTPKGEKVAVKAESAGAKYAITVSEEAHGQWSAEWKGLTVYASSAGEACTELFERVRKVAA